MICRSFLWLLMVGVPSMSGDVVEGSESFKCFTRRLRFWEDTPKKQSICIATLKITSPQLCQTCTDLCKVIYESEMSPLQLCAGQCRQGVGIVQLFAVVWWKQVWIQANHMCGICKAQEGTFSMADPTWWAYKHTKSTQNIFSDLAKCKKKDQNNQVQALSATSEIPKTVNTGVDHQGRCSG